MNRDGLLLFAHGARDPGWAGPFEAVLAAVRRRQPALPARLAFLEFMAPTLTEAGEALVADGCTHVAVVPLFLGAGGHVRKDIPALLSGLAEAHPRVTWTLTRAIGEDPEVVAAMAEASLARARHPTPSDHK
jgi:sirohydrochlorin cobaltochelatase